MEVIIVLILLFCILFGAGYMLRRRIYKDVDRLEAWRIEIRNRSIIDELSKVKELKMVGQTEKLFEQWRNEWDEILTTQLPEVEELLFDAEGFSDKYQFKKAQNVLEHIEDVLKTVEENIEKIILEINELVTSKEKNIVESVQIKEQFKKVKKTLLAHGHQFGKAHGNLEEKLAELTTAFKQFDSETEEGNYLSAREILVKIKRELDRLQNKINDIPKLLTECNITIPNLLKELEEGYNDMVDNGYYLDHLQVDVEIEKINKQLTVYRQQLEGSEIDDIVEDLQVTQESIDSIYDLLEKEVEASLFVRQAKETINRKLVELTEQKLETLEETALVKQSYQLSEAELGRQKLIDKQLAQVEKKFAHIDQNLQSEHVAHSFIKEELIEIEKQVVQLFDEHNQYRDMLQTLRKDELQAREQLSQLKRILLNTTRVIQQSNIPGLPPEFLGLIDESKKDIQLVSLKLDEIPLNMMIVNQLLDDAIHSVESLEGHANELIEQVKLVEYVIQYGNRYRSRNVQLDEKFIEAEELFRETKYNKSLEVAAAALEQIEPNSITKIQEIVNSKQHS
jgi:septation ring formation regulator